MPIEILAYEDTPLGTLCLRRRELVSRPGTLVTEVTLNHEFLMSSYLTASERALASLGLQRVAENGNDKLDVLVGGLGLGYTAAEALDSNRVGSVEVVEYLPEVIGWMHDGKVPLSDHFNGDHRIKITCGDIYERLQCDGSQQFDIVIIDVDHSPQDVLGEQSKDFYTIKGLQSVATHLRSGGIFGIWSYADDTPLLNNMRSVFDDVEVEQITVFNDLINIDQTDWLFFGRRRE